MRDRTLKTVAVAFTVVMIVAMVASGAGAAAPATVETDDTVEDVDYATANDSDGAGVSASLQQASGETVVLLGVERGIGMTEAAASDDPMGDLEADSQVTQEPVLDALRSEFSAEVRNTYWAGNVITATVDLDEHDPESLLRIDGVVSVSENVEYERPEPETPTDSVPSELDGNFTFGLEQINVPAYDEEFDGMGDGATIMIGDDGISDPEEGHPDLDFELEAIVEDGEVDEGSLVGGEEGSHGEHVSGTAAGAEDPVGDVPRYGVAPNADLLKADVFAGGAVTEDIIASMEWAAENDADAASFSLGFPPTADDSTFSDLYVPVIEDVNAAGTSAVVSAGNSGSGDAGGPVTSPATNFDSVAIGASTEAEDIATFSSGAVIDDDSVEFIDGDELPERFPDEFVQPDVSAPGEDVLSSGPLGPEQIDDEATYSFASGTSMAAPHYAGAVALVQSATEEDLDNSVIEAALAETAEKPENEFTELNNRDIRFGTGIIDVHAAAEAAMETQTIEGTVTSDDGEPLVGATVETDAGALTATDEDGEFVLQTTNDPATVTADATGVGAETVTVEDGEDVDFELEEELDVTLIEDQPPTLEAGDSFDIVAEVQNLDQLMIELTDNSTINPDDLALALGDDEIPLGEPVETDGLSGEVAITVDVAEDAIDTEFSLEHTFERFDEDPGEAVFEVNDLEAPATAEPGELIDVSAMIENVGDDEGTQTVAFEFENETVAEQDVSLDANESAEITFEDVELPDEEGEFEHGVVTDDDGEFATIVIEEVDAEATVSFVDDEIVFGPDSTIDAALETDALDVAGYQFELEYDPDVVEVDGVSSGDVGSSPTFNVDNDEGVLAVTDSQADGNDTPVLAGVTFEFVGEPGDETDVDIVDENTIVTTADPVDDLDTVGEDAQFIGGELGDVNADGEITPSDAVLTQQFLADEEFDDNVTFIEELADVTQSGEITVSDVLAIEELIIESESVESIAVDGTAQSETAVTDGGVGVEDDEIVVVTGPTEVLEEIEGPDFELSDLDQPETLEIDEDIISEVDLTNEGDETGSIEILHGTDLDDSLVFIPAEIEEIELAPGETETVEKNLGSFEDINDALDSGFEPGDDVLTGFQIGDNLDPNLPPLPDVEQELAENITIAGSDFDVSDLEAPGEGEPGESIDVNATVTNLGTDADTQDIEFVFEGDVVDSTEVTLDPDESVDIEFTDIELPEEDGVYEHGVFSEDDDETATITVGDVDAVAVVDETTFAEEERTLSDEERERLEDTDEPVTEVGDDLVERVEAQTTAEVIPISSEEAADAAGEGTYDAFVLNEMDPDEIEAFDDAVEEGVVWLDGWGTSSNAIDDKSEVLENPESTDQSDLDPNPDLEIAEDHPLFEDVGEEGDSFLIHDATFADHTWFDGYEGGDVIGQIQAGGVDDGDAVAVNDDETSVLLSSFGSTTFVADEDFTDEADTLLGNAVAYVLDEDDDVDDGGVEIADLDPAEDLTVDPETDLEINATVENTANDTLTQDVEFVFDGDALVSEEVELEPEDSETVTFEVTAPEDGGEFEWFVATDDDQSATYVLTVDASDEVAVAVVDEDTDPSDSERERATEEGVELDPQEEGSDVVDRVADEVDAAEIDLLSGAEAVDAAEDDEYDVYVVNQMDPDEIDAFDAETDGDTAGVVWLDQWGDTSNGVADKSAALDNPAETSDDDFTSEPVLNIAEDHPVFSGIDGDSFVIHTSEFSDHAFFSDYDGTVIGEVETDQTFGNGIGVDEEKGTILLSSFGSSEFVDSNDYTSEADVVLGNAVEYVASEDDDTDSADASSLEPIAIAP